MFLRLLLAAALLSACTASSVNGPPKKVQGFAGGHVILPCSIVVTEGDDYPTVEWSKEGLKKNIVFLYRVGCETYGEKNPAFEFRTSLLPKVLKYGNISLRISNLQLSDTGKYHCKTLWTNDPWEITTVELNVGAVSEPKLSVVSSGSENVTLECESNCWMPAPEIQFLDDAGKNIPADDPKTDQDVNGCYNVTRRVTLQDATKRVTCRVHQQDIDQTRTTDILTPVFYISSCFETNCIAVAVAIAVALFPLGFCLWNRKRVSGLLRSLKSSCQSVRTDASEMKQFLEEVKVDNAVNSSTEELSRRVADLEVMLKKKEDIIRELLNDLISRPHTVRKRRRYYVLDSRFKSL